MPTFKIERLGKKFLDNLRDQSTDMRVFRAMDNQLLQIAAYRDAYNKACANAQIDRKIQECLVLQQGMDEAARKREAAQCVARAPGDRFVHAGAAYAALSSALAD